MIFLLILIFLINFNSVQTKSLKNILHSNEYPTVENGKLDLSNYDLTSIEGIDYYPDISKVENLILRDNKLKSIEPLSNLSKYHIKSLDLACNKIKDLKPLRNFFSLEELYLEGNLIDLQNIQFIISNLKNLVGLMVDANPINNFKYKYCEKRFKQINYLEMDNFISTKTINNINLIFYGESQENECPICCDNTDLYKTNCNHYYHLHCINKWAEFCKENEKEPICPVCRSDLID